LFGEKESEMVLTNKGISKGSGFFLEFGKFGSANGSGNAFSNRCTLVFTSGRSIDHPAVAFNLDSYFNCSMNTVFGETTSYPTTDFINGGSDVASGQCCFRVLGTGITAGIT
jgi:hypothetical protein